jgi:hypothetical protein
MNMMSQLQNQFNEQNKNFFGNNKKLGVLQSGRGGLPTGRGGLMRQGTHLPGKVTKLKKFVQNEIDDVKKIEPKKAIEEEGEEVEKEDNTETDNFLKGEVSSPFEKAAESSEEEPEPSKVAPEKKKLDETIMKQTSSGQKKVITRLFQTESYGKAYKQNARSKPVMFIPDKGDPVAYESMSAMVRVTGLSKAKLVGNKAFSMKGAIKRSSTAMNRAGLKGIIVSADDAMFTAMQLTPLSGKTNKVQQRFLAASIPEAPTGEVSDNSTSVKKSQQLSIDTN